MNGNENDGILRALVFLIRAGMREKGWTQKRLAQEIGKTPVQVSRLLRGKSQGKRSTWEDMISVSVPLEVRHIINEDVCFNGVKQTSGG